MANSLVRRVALGSAVAASAAALVAAFATIAVASYLVQQAEDRRLEDAAVTFAIELNHDGVNAAAIREVHRDETAEMEHTGMLFAVYDAQSQLLVGNPRLVLPATNGCASADASALRVCRAPSPNGLIAVVGAAHTSLLPALAGSAAFAVLLAAILALLASRPISRVVVAPLTRLRERVATLDPNAISQADLGANDDVVEVDALRGTIAQLIVRVEHALAQAHRFAANAAHELRTPLTSVQGELELLAECLADAQAKDGALRAQRKLVELSVLVERLLILSVPVRKADDAREVVSLRDLFEDAVGALATGERSCIRLSEDDAQVHGDAALLGAMISNAITNGLKFGSTVSTHVSVVGNDAILRIDDDGRGVDASERERVFEPFFRSQDALRRHVPGHGLGLAMIRHVARMHGGDAHFADTSKKGARLVIRLPIAR